VAGVWVRVCRDRDQRGRAHGRSGHARIRSRRGKAASNAAARPRENPGRISTLIETHGKQRCIVGPDSDMSPGLRRILSTGQGPITRRVGPGVAEVWRGLLAGGSRDLLQGYARPIAQADAEILCPYGTAELDPAVIADARRTHPLLLSSGRRPMSPEYTVPSDLLPSRSLPLPAPTGDAMNHTYRTDLSQVRALVLQHAREAGLSESRANDLVLAVSEVAANTLRHTASSGTLSLWRDADEVVAEIRDEGMITDPLAGRRRPPPDAPGGHGLWLVHQVCDLVELHSDAGGTTIRMHMAIEPSKMNG
jgi:anti-sigma regulatory factor (Ser/Thr protein kinase)